MVAEGPRPIDDAQAPIPTGQLHWLRAGKLALAIAPEAGGRIAQLRFDGVDWLVADRDADAACIGWGCYPMVPWAGRVRGGSFKFDGRAYTLPLNFGAHAIHGVGFSRAWRVESLEAAAVGLALTLPQDAYWPFGGRASQTIRVQDNRLHLQLAVQAGARAMPAVLGWHPWFRKPDRMLFAPEAMYRRDADGIATLPLIKATPGPWDDCFVASGAITLERAGQRLSLRSDADHWVIYDGAAHATCVEPQTGPPDAFTLAPYRLAPGERLSLAFELSWDWAEQQRVERDVG